MSDPKVRKLTLMKSARVGYTQMLITYIASQIVNSPGSILLVQPTIQDAEDFSKESIEPMLDWPIMKSLSFLRSVQVKRADTISVKRFPGGILRARGANSPNAARRISVDDLLMDEIDGYPVNVGPDGDPLSVFEKRLEQSHSPKDIRGSTPTEESVSKVYPSFLEGDQRHFHVPCKTCGKHQKLVWGDADDDKPGIKWFPKDKPTDVWYQCENGCRIEERDKWSMQVKGQWIADNPEAFERTGHVSMHINTIYSFQPGAGWLDLVYDFLAKRKSPLTLKAFINTTLGEVWRFRGQAPEWKRLYERREDYRYGTVPWGGCFLTAGVDVQESNGGRLEVHVYAWGRGAESWLVERIELPGSPWEKKVWNDLEEVLRRKWPHANGEMMGLEREAVDVSYATMQGYRFCKKFGLHWCLPVRGMSKGNLLAPPIAESTKMEIDVGNSKKSEVRVHTIGTHVLKQELYGYLGIDKPIDGEPYPYGYVHLPTGVGEEFCQQLVAEDWIPEKMEWVKRRANEALDCWVYARAAAIHRGADRWTEAEWLILLQRYASPENRPVIEQEPPVIRQAVEVSEPVRPVAPDPEPAERPGQYIPPRKKSWLRG